MSPEAAAEFRRLFDLVEGGVLPERAIARLFYLGHDIVHTYENGPEQTEWKCVSCGVTWTGSNPHTCGNPDVFVTNYRHDARWRCRSCAAEWDSDVGMKCPSCNACAHAGGGIDTCCFCGATLR